MFTPTNQHQVDIFSNDIRQLQFAELCNALYEREILNLSQFKGNNVSLLKSRLSGLTHHIKKAAEHLLNNNAPIEIDIHNGSWQSKQAAKCMASKYSADKIFNWFNQHAQMGIAVPIYVMELGIEQFEIDSIDRINLEDNTVHVNKHGWFNFNGQPLEQNRDPLRETKLLLPNKSTLSAACCGHSWNHKGRYQPRTISLRELLLSTTINWKTFT